MPSIKLPLYLKRIRSTADLDARDNIIGYALCDMTGTTIMKNESETVCREIMSLCNGKHTPKQDYGEMVVILRVPIEPMEKPASQIVTVDRNGEQIVADSPKYADYKRRFVRVVKESGIVLPETPIDYRCQVIVRAYSSNTVQKSIPAYAESTLDCLVAAGILKNKGYKIVNNIDGSRIYCDENNPRLVIVIKEWRAKK